MPGAVAPDTIGPVDVAVIEFEGNRFNGEVAPALRALQDQGTVRIIDLTFVRKGKDGSVDVVELADSEVAGAFENVYDTQFDLLSEDDLADIAGELDAGSSAVVIVWENSWAARLSAAIRGSHGKVVAMERIPRDTVLDAFAALGAK